MEMFASVFGHVELTVERWNHITTFHPEVRTHRKLLQKTLLNPDAVRNSKHDPSVKICYHAIPKRNKYLAVVVKIDKRNFILTAYSTGKIKH